jgi:hypothetical protein
MPYSVPGPISITYNTYSLGVTKSGAIIRVNTSLVPVTDDHGGGAPRSHIFGGKSVMVDIIGLDVALLKASGVWTDEILMTGSIGALASGAGHTLIMQELYKSDSANRYWKAQTAFPLHPREINMRSTQELNFPITFVIIPVSGVFFQVVPNYLRATNFAITPH